MEAHPNNLNCGVKGYAFWRIPCAVMKYQKFLFYLSIAVLSLFLVITLIIAIRIYPAFAFFGIISTEVKQHLAELLIIPATISAICIILINLIIKRLSKITIAAIFVYTIALFIPINVNPYDYCALMFYLIPTIFTFGLMNFITPKNKIAACTSISLLSITYLIMIIIVFLGKWILVVNYLYLMIPCIIFTNMTILTCRKISWYTLTALYLTAFVSPMYNIFWHITNLGVQLGIFFIASVAVTVFLFIMDIKKTIVNNDII